MRAPLLGIAALAFGSLAVASPASALPFAGSLTPGNGVEQARVVSRTVVRGPRCRTVVTKRRGPFGRVVVVRKRECF
ncbi:hypothetical protein [Methylobacterium gnaphalii]|uniref:Uncharacterized protein n=1 Tax=Methylobacterium gnaphalii TaxID=1010610 RepID=A0A512JE10_9HYPH|nr:hypothetical protein [Methylobacterium gnaphalii]GEP08182.1 hypothetical protein MGN01_00270 [Methylobacterium gnaphalii]GJD68221.1 hypothetical protein MMMDOFMJ_1140 [Methylobacterium gnaphalii]GLS51187.1 hypothetical protein GCM10007885_40410 [Methylobacterium gnaphalii]